MFTSHISAIVNIIICISTSYSTHQSSVHKQNKINTVSWHPPSETHSRSCRRLRFPVVVFLYWLLLADDMEWTGNALKTISNCQCGFLATQEFTAGLEVWWKNCAYTQQPLIKLGKFFRGCMKIFQAIWHHLKAIELGFPMI